MSDPKPFSHGYLQVDDLHSIYFEEYGAKHGKPVLFVHGGPGGTVSSTHTSFFNLNAARVVLFEQRGAGRSRPTAEIRQNNTQLLVEDIEKLRESLKIDQWQICFGGSWGSGLSMVYAQTHPARVKSLIIRAVWTGRKAELAFSRGGSGAARIYPLEYERFVDHLAPEDREDPISGYYKLMRSTDPTVVKAAARAWNRWDLTMTSIQASPYMYNKLEDETWCLTHAMLETHYFSNGGFLEEGQLLKEENIAKIRHMPVGIVQGRFDMFTPPQTAWEVHQALPKSSLHIVQGAGHTPNDPGMTAMLKSVVEQHMEI